MTRIAVKERLKEIEFLTVILLSINSTALRVQSQAARAQFVLQITIIKVCVGTQRVCFKR